VEIMGETLITVTAIFLAAILMFVFPLITVSERSDDISQLNIQTTTSQFVDNIKSTGKLTSENYDNFVQTLSATGNTYDVELEFKILDDNPKSKAGIGTTSDKIGENVYYSVYTSQIESQIDSTRDTSGKNGVYKLKEGDIVSVSVKNTNTTISQMLRNFIYSLAGNDTYSISASSSGMVTNTGN